MLQDNRGSVDSGVISISNEEAANGLGLNGNRSLNGISHNGSNGKSNGHFNGKFGIRNGLQSNGSPQLRLNGDYRRSSFKTG